MQYPVLFGEFVLQSKVLLSTSFVFGLLDGHIFWDLVNCDVGWDLIEGTGVFTVDENMKLDRWVVSLYKVVPTSDGIKCRIYVCTLRHETNVKYTQASCYWSLSKFVWSHRKTQPHQVSIWGHLEEEEQSR
jgi:hypothetical protein